MALHSSKHSVSKRRAGRTPISETPLRIRVSGVDLTPEVKEGTHTLLGRRLARFGPWIERVDVRFKDINGPARGGPDTRCRINLTVSGRPSVFAEERAHDVDRALFRAASSVSRAMARSVERKGLSAPTLTRPAPPPSATRSRGDTESTPEPRGRRRIRGMVYKFEESATTPSRKSSRKSKSGLKTGNKLARRTQRRKHAPKARAARAQRQRREARR
jgi:sigma 54 modulation/S30EA-like ribosomal protein